MACIYNALSSPLFIKYTFLLEQQSMMGSAPPTLEIDAASMPIRASNNNRTIELPSESRDNEQQVILINNFDKNFNVIPGNPRGSFASVFFCIK